MRKLLLQQALFLITITATSTASAHSNPPASKVNTVCSVKTVYTTSKLKQGSKKYDKLCVKIQKSKTVSA